MILPAVVFEKDGQSGASSGDFGSLGGGTIGGSSDRDESGDDEEPPPDDEEPWNCPSPFRN
jgi:hypothetical protein